MANSSSENYEEVLRKLPPLGTVEGKDYVDKFFFLAITDTEFLDQLMAKFPVEFMAGAFQRKFLQLLYEYYEKNLKAPSTNLESYLNIGKKKLGDENYSFIINFLSRISKIDPEDVDREFMFSSIDDFIYTRKGFHTSLNLVKAFDVGNTEKADELVATIAEIRDDRMRKFREESAYVEIESVEKRIYRRSVLQDNYLLRWGIKPFDDNGIFLDRKQMIIVAAPEKLGKTWCGIYLAKTAALAGLNVLMSSHGDLSKEEMEERLDQSITSSFNFRQREDDSYEVKRFDRDDRETSSLKEVGTTADAGKLWSKINFIRSMGGKIILKYWPMNTCSAEEYRQYIIDLRRRKNFVPDVIINDYPEIMKLPSTERSGIDFIFKEHKRWAGEFNCLVIGFSQVKAIAYKHKWITMADFAEDKRKAAHCDGAYALCKTPEEELEGKARFVLFVDRNFGKKGLAAELIQDYKIGQFCISSRRIQNIEEGEEKENQDE